MASSRIKDITVEIGGDTGRLRDFHPREHAPTGRTSK